MPRRPYRSYSGVYIVPIPFKFIVPWAIGGLLASVLAGAITALVYKPKAAAPEAPS